MSASIFVCKLPIQVNERYLRTLFSRYGEVHSVKIVKDRDTRKSKGFGFIRMSERDAENAIQHLNGSIQKGQKIIVQHDNKN